MFPLGSVVFPGQVIPLHVFEDRYQQMLRHCLDDDSGSGAEFGVVLIERGSEVGGGDVRSRVGTAVRIAEAVAVAEGHWAVIGVGARRIRVTEWETDDPWPRARVVDLPDADPDPDVSQPWDELRRQYRRVMAMASEVLDFEPAEGEPADDPAIGTFHVAALSPLAAFDCQRVLATESTSGRITLLAEMLEDLEFRLRGQIELG